MTELVERSGSTPSTRRSDIYFTTAGTEIRGLFNELQNCTTSEVISRENFTARADVFMYGCSAVNQNPKGLGAQATDSSSDPRW